MALYGAYEDEPQTLGAPRPAYGQSQDGRGDRKQVRLSLGVSGAGGVPLRLGGRAGNHSADMTSDVKSGQQIFLGLHDAPVLRCGRICFAIHEQFRR